MKIEKVERFIIFGCCFLLCLICIQALIVHLSFGMLPISKILTVELSLVLTIICVLGCSVYHVQMWTDANSGSSLLNNLYSTLAVILQVQSVLLCSQILANIFYPSDEKLCYFVEFVLWFSRVFNFYHIIILTILHVYRQYRPTGYLNMSVDPRGKWIIFVIEFLVSLIFFIVLLWNRCSDDSLSYSCGLQIFGPIVRLVCFLLLLKVTEDGYGLWKRTKRILTCLRKRNSVTPFDEETGVEQVQFHENDDQV